MNNRFPKFTRPTRSGESGVNMISNIVHDKLHWIFRRNHNEHDFGIDGYIDLVSLDNSVTGKCLAVQIKHGPSYFTQKDEYGYIYHGETKHLNYWMNHPIPVLILLCDSTNGHCFWEHFHPSKTEKTNGGWKMTIPTSNVFDESAIQILENLAGPAKDYSDELSNYWKENNILQNEADLVIYIIPREDIESLNIDNTIGFFERLLATKSLAKSLQGKIDFAIDGYDDDPRELWQIPEVRSWFKAVEKPAKHWFYFLTNDTDSSGLPTLAFCRCRSSWLINPSKNKGKRGRVQIDLADLGPFFMRNFSALNEISDWVGLSQNENKEISYKIAKCLGYPGPKL